VEEGNWTSSSLHSKQLLCCQSLHSSNVNKKTCRQSNSSSDYTVSKFILCDYASIEYSVFAYFRYRSLVIKSSLAGSTDHCTGKTSYCTNLCAVKTFIINQVSQFHLHAPTQQQFRLRNMQTPTHEISQLVKR